MVKGISRQVIVVQAPDPDLFEQAIFILKDGQQGISDNELLKEAKRLINAKSIYARRYGVKACVFSASAGALITGVLWLFTVLF